MRDFAVVRSNERLTGTLVDGASGLLASADRDKNLAVRAGNIMQALFCLSYLMGSNGHDTSKVHQYANLAEEKLKELSELMQPVA